MKTETKLKKLINKKKKTEKDGNKLFELWEKFKGEETERHIHDFCEKNEYTSLEMEQLIEEGTIYLLDGAIIDPDQLFTAKVFLCEKIYGKDKDDKEVVESNKTLDTFNIKLKLEGEK